jgi:hypothetical protein
LEANISDHSEVFFGHGYCPDCFGTAMDEVEALQKWTGKYRGPEG